MSEFRRKKIMFSFRNHFDYDHNGIVDDEDIAVAVRKIAALRNLAKDDPKYHKIDKSIKELWKSMMEHADANEDGKITPEEWMKMWLEFGENPDTPRTWMTLYRDVAYNVLDLNDDGHITREEFVKVHTHYELEKEEIEEAFDKTTGGSDILTKEEFFKYWKDYFTSDDKKSPGNYLLGTTKY